MIVETILAVGLCKISNEKRSAHELHNFAYGSASKNCFQIASGITLEDKVEKELKNIPGVNSVSSDRRGNDLTVNVFLENLDFSTFEKVANNELELSSAHPELNVYFNVETMAA